MTDREALLSVVETLDDEQIARLLGYAEGLAQPSAPSVGTGFRDSDVHEGHPVDDPLIALIGAGRSPKPTRVAEHKDAYLAEALGHRGQ